MTQSTSDPLEDALKRRVGTVLRRKYRLDRLLGVGGMGAVFAATHRNGSEVAVKILHPELAQIPQLRSRFLREGYVANQVAHPGVVRISDDDDDDEHGTVFLVMELLHGESLDARWERSRHRLPLSEVLLFADSVLEVLAVAHAKGIVHRDIKPENLFVTHTGELKVLDFGIARLRDGTSTTRTGQLLGTPGFMSPEQANGRVHQVDARSDLWSLGATIFTLLSGQHVHPAQTAPEQMIYAATQQARPIEWVAPGLPPAVAAVVNRALAFDAQHRWPSATEMRNALRAGGSGAPLPAGEARRALIRTLAATVVDTDERR